MAEKQESFSDTWSKAKKQGAKLRRESVRRAKATKDGRNPTTERTLWEKAGCMWDGTCDK